MPFCDWKICTAHFPQYSLRYKQLSSFPGPQKLLPTISPNLEAGMEKEPKWQGWKTRGNCSPGQPWDYSCVPAVTGGNSALSPVSPSRCCCNGLTTARSCTSSQETLKEDTGENTIGASFSPWAPSLPWKGSHSSYLEGSNSSQEVAVSSLGYFPVAACGIFLQFSC